MLKYLDTLTDVGALFKFQNFLLGRGKQGFTYVSNFIVRKHNPAGYTPHSLYPVGCADKEVYLIDKIWNVWTYNFEDELYRLNFNKAVKILQVKNDDEYFYNEVSNSNQYNYYYYKNGKIQYALNDVPPLFFHLSHNVLFYLTPYIQSVLYCHSSITGERLWEYDAKERASFYDIVLEKQMDGKVVSYQFYKNFLIIYSGMGHFACVELNSGKILWEVNFEGFASFGIDHVEGKLHARWGFISYRIIDLKTGAIELEMPFVEKLRSQQVDIVLTWFCVSGQKLYACTKKGELVALNKYTLDLMERYILPGNDDGIPDANAPIKMGNRIYIHDGNQQLHIFEEQDL